MVVIVVVIMIIVFQVLLGLEDGTVGGQDLILVFALGGLKLDLVEQDAVVPVPGDLLLDNLGGGDTGVAERAERAASCPMSLPTCPAPLL